MAHQTMAEPARMDFLDPTEAALDARLKALTRVGTNIFYVYTHSGPEGVFYVGKGVNNRATDFWTRSQYHLRKLTKIGRENVKIRIAPAESEQQAYDIERLVIEAFRLNGAQLCNHEEGGGKGSRRTFTLEHRAKLSAAGMGHGMSEEARKKIAAANTGRKHTPEARANMSKKTLSDSHKAVLLKAITGRVKSVEERKKIGEAGKGRKASLETIEKLRLSHLGKKQSPEQIAKRVASIKKTLAEKKSRGE